MFGKLFGKGPVKEEAKPVKDPHEAIQDLTRQCEIVEKRIKVLDNKSKELKATALAKKKAGDQRGALLALKQSKMQEKELAKLDGQSMMLEQQKMMIESANFDIGVVNGIKGGKDVIASLNKQMNVDDIANLKDELDDMMQENAERQDYFAGVAQEGQDELMGELDELEALAAEDEMQ